MKTEGGRVVASEIGLAEKETGKFASSTEKAHKHVNLLSGAFGHLKSAATFAAGTAGLAGVGFGIGKIVDSASAFQDQQSQLNSALKASRVHTRGAASDLSDYADTIGQKGGFVPPQTLAGLTQFIRLTKNVQESERLMSISTNVARGAHVSLERAERAVTMAEQGRTTGLARLGVTVTPITKAHQALANATGKVTSAMSAAATREDQRATGMKALDVLQRRFTGSTSTYSKTLAGASNNLRTMIDVIGEKLGAKLVPAITKGVQWLSKLVRQFEAGRGAGGRLRAIADSLGRSFKDLFGWVKQNWKMVAELTGVALGGVAAFKAFMVIQDVTKAIKGAVILFKALRAGTLAETIAQMDLNVAFLANPIGIVVIALAALVAGFIVAYNKVKWFREGVQAVWGWLKTATLATMHAAVKAFDVLKAGVTAIIGFVGKHWKLILSILTGPVGAAVIFITTHFGQIRDVAAKVVGWVTTPFGKVISFLKGIPRQIAQVGGSMWDGLKTGLASVVNWIIDRINNIIGIINSVDHITIFGHRIGAGNISPLAHIGASTGTSRIASAGNVNAATAGGSQYLRNRAPVADLRGRGRSSGEQTYVPPTVIVEHHSVTNLDGKVLYRSVERQRAKVRAAN